MSKQFGEKYDNLIIGLIGFAGVTIPMGIFLNKIFHTIGFGLSISAFIIAVACLIGDKSLEWKHRERFNEEKAAGSLPRKGETRK